MGTRLTVALGLDLGLSTGWAVVRLPRGSTVPVVVEAGNVVVAHLEGPSMRVGAWAEQVGALAARVARQRNVTACAYEEIRRMVGQGARYILMMEGALHGMRVLPAFGVNQAALRSFAGMRPTSKSNPNPESWSMRSIATFSNPELLRTTDQAVAAFAALWLCTQGEHV